LNRLTASLFVFIFFDHFFLDIAFTLSFKAVFRIFFVKIFVFENNLSGR